MSVQLPNGSVIAIASTYGASKAISALSNASVGVATLEASHGILENDFMEVTSGWSRLNNKIVKAGTVSTNDVNLLGINTSNTGVYSPGGGVGSVREITAWTQLSQILTSNSSGGEQQFLEYQFLEDDAQKRIPTFKNASGLEFSIADDAALPGYILAAEANDDRLPRAVRVTLPSGGVILYNAYISLNKTPTLVQNELMAVQITLSLLAEVVRY